MARRLGKDQKPEMIERVHDRARNITALLCSPSEAYHYFKLATCCKTLCCLDFMSRCFLEYGLLKTHAGFVHVYVADVAMTTEMAVCPSMLIIFK